MDGRNPYDPDEDGLYDFTEDQIQAMLELDLLQREAVECPGTSLLAITYDIQARLEEVNKALAEDPTPMESNRSIRVAFKTEVVDLVVPPEEVPSDEEYEAEDEQDATNISNDISQDENSDEEIVRLDPEECEQAALSPIKSEKESGGDEEADKDLLDDSPLLSTDDSSVDQTTINFSLEDEAAELQKDKAVQSEDAGLEAEKDQKNSRGHNRLRRPKQSRPSLNNKGDEENSHSTLLSGSDFSNNRRHKSTKEREEEEEDKKRKEAADLAFQSWLRHKRQKAREQRRRERKENEERKRVKEPQVDTSAVLKDYWRRKRREARQKQKEFNRQNEELQRQEELRLRNRQEVEMAYQRWVKMKKQQARLAQDEEQRRQMITKLSLRNSRRSQALALALSTAGSFVDYYGYR